MRKYFPPLNTPKKKKKKIPQVATVFYIYNTLINPLKGKLKTTKIWVEMQFNLRK